MQTVAQLIRTIKASPKSSIFVAAKLTENDLTYVKVTRVEIIRVYSNMVASHPSGSDYEVSYWIDDDGSINIG